MMMELTPSGNNHVQMRIDSAEEQHILRQAVYRTRRIGKVGLERALQTSQPGGRLAYPRQVILRHAQLDRLVEDMGIETLEAVRTNAPKDPLGALRDQMVVKSLQYFMSRELH